MKLACHQLGAKEDDNRMFLPKKTLLFLHPAIKCLKMYPKNLNLLRMNALTSPDLPSCLSKKSSVTCPMTFRLLGEPKLWTHAAV